MEEPLYFFAPEEYNSIRNRDRKRRLLFRIFHKYMGSTWNV